MLVEMDLNSVLRLPPPMLVLAQMLPELPQLALSTLLLTVLTLFKKVILMLDLMQTPGQMQTDD
jgi:hypothetical protein